MVPFINYICSFFDHIKEKIVISRYQARIPEEQEKQDVMIEENYANVEATTNFESSQHQQQQPSSTEITNLKQSESIKVA
ncbi:unnamed protein product [Acanthocheilonema viteae]|uniref:Uncharacterized protein n=1 Tax=Acanthocheilonema viteae TaxID=6277 RepID=A0A498SKA9_ACAVI|nr:unnamed protein product [Acanthocheilonema viteae]